MARIMETFYLSILDKHPNKLCFYLLLFKQSITLKAAVSYTF